MHTQAVRKHRPSGSRRIAGFTLLELMTTLTVAGLLLAIGVPSYMSIVRNNRAATNANELVSALTIARSEAVRRGDRVTICASDDGAACGGTWADGWIIILDGAASDTTWPPVADEVLRAWGAPSGAASVATLADGSATAVPWVRFLPRGDTRAQQAFPITFHMEIDDCVGEVARNIEINPIGRAVATRGDCS